MAREFDLDHGHVVIAAITSCTNTSNPQVMIGAGLVAKKAVELGLQSKPWVKTSLAPGSRVVMDYFDRAGLVPYLDKLGFDLVGFGCTTCIGNSGPLLPEISEAINTHGLACAAVLSGNRNFEGRIHPDVRMNYLASPPLVVAYALAGTMDIDLVTEPLGVTADGRPVTLADLWPSAQEVAEVLEHAVGAEMFRSEYANAIAGDDQWRVARGPDRASGTPGTNGRPTCRDRRFSRGCEPSRSRSPTSPAPGCWRSSATASRPTTSRPPARSGRRARPASGCRTTACRSPSSTPTAPGGATTRS